MVKILKGSTSTFLLTDDTKIHSHNGLVKKRRNDIISFPNVLTSYMLEIYAPYILKDTIPALFQVNIEDIDMDINKNIYRSLLARP